MELRDTEAAVSRLQGEAERIRGRLHTMYLDKLDGVIDEAFYATMSKEFNAALSRCNRDIESCHIADESHMEDGIRLLDLAQKAEGIFAPMKPYEKRQLLGFVLSNCTWADNELTPTFREPFGIIAESARIAAGSRPPEG